MKDTEQRLDSEHRFYIGVDTSNYTTSCALFETSKAKFYSNTKCLLTVPEGGRGLRQSDAVFAHVKNLPKVTAEAFSKLEPSGLYAVGVSVSPRDAEGSYMPCFLTGEAAAASVANAFGKPLCRFSHQAGHIMAAVWSSGSPELLKGNFIAFHVSGGTTELLLVSPDISDGLKLQITTIGGTFDLNAGQAIDRCGVRMGLKFPCGPKLEELALANTEPFGRRAVSVDGCGCNLSGVENIAANMLDGGKSRECVAAFLLDYIGRTLLALTRNALSAAGELPVLYAGGVMSNSIIKRMIKGENIDARFASPEFSSDNAAGIALLCAAAEEGLGFWTK